MLTRAAILSFALAALSVAVLQAEQPASPVSQQDKTGTNPVNFQRELRLFNEYQHLPDSYRNLIDVRYYVPIWDRKGSLRFTLPLVATDIGVGSDVGVGDFNCRVNYIPKLARKWAWIVGLETEWNTASEDTLGSGKNTLAPSVIYARFLPGGRIFAPAYQQKFSTSGDGDRPDINLGMIDLYYVMQKRNGWIIFDPSFLIDYENDRHVASQLEVEMGRILGLKWGGMSSLYVRPGIGIGAHRAYDWSLELGYKIVGF